VDNPAEGTRKRRYRLKGKEQTVESLLTLLSDLVGKHLAKTASGFIFIA
jgi:hypothetical protein